ncbi:MAG: WYL domain-containing protein, partial [Actinobacteria bacterium]|nr:WYL domain-containing protein [Actinomycetota bacterium]
GGGVGADLHRFGEGGGHLWYLVAGTEAGQRTFRVDRVTSVEATGRPVVRPEGFELADAWRLITEDLDQRRTPVRARGRASTEVVPFLRSVLGGRCSVGPTGPDGRVDVELRGHSPRSLAAEIAGFGAEVEISHPPELRERLAAIAAELSATYAEHPDPSSAARRASTSCAEGRDGTDLVDRPSPRGW